jgi:hypothetical protein
MLPIDCAVVKWEVSWYASYRYMTKKNPHAVALGRRRSAKKAASSARNARKATRTRMITLTPEERSAQAKRAASVRWGKKH